jgi:hypothetical protein
MKSPAASGRITAWEMAAWKSDSDVLLGMGKEAVRFESFVVDFIEAGDLVIPLEQGGDAAAALDGAFVKVPDGIDHGMIVGIENVFLELGVTGKMRLRDTLRGHGVDVIHRIEAVVPGRDVDVVYIKQDSAVRRFDNLVQKLLTSAAPSEKFVISCNFSCDSYSNGYMQGCASIEI